jgi:hypothetical protein
MGRKPLPPSQRKKQFNLLMDDATRAILEKFATERGVTVADEIRRRIAASLNDEEWFDATTRWLAHEISVVAEGIKRQTGYSWHQHPKSREALASGISTLLEQAAAELGQRPVGGEDTWGPDDPQTLGRTVARGRRGRGQIADAVLGDIFGGQWSILEMRGARPHKGKPKR